MTTATNQHAAGHEGHDHDHHGHDHAHGEGDHDHGGGGHHHHDLRHASRRALLIALAISLTYMVVELVGGVVTGSLSLLADGVHMVGDVGSIILALIAMWVATHPASLQRTFGYQRAEMIAAFVNALSMILIAVWILFQAEQRIVHGEYEIEAGLTLIIAVVGLFFNFAAMWAVRDPSHANLNVAGVYIHLLGDALSSVGVIIAALLTFFFGWFLADPIASIVIAVLILISSARLIWEVAEVLLNSTPKHLNIVGLVYTIEATNGVKSLHNVRAWTLTSGTDVFSAHVTLDEAQAVLEARRGIAAGQLLEEIRDIARNDFGIAHVTIQLESDEDHCDESSDDDFYRSENVHSGAAGTSSTQPKLAS